MKKVILSIILMFLMTSCATITEFPVSSVTPAAKITASLKRDKQNNFAITITANYLASPDRLSPAKNTYVVWIVTRQNDIKNIGQLNFKNANKTTLATLTAFEPVEIFITAEDDGSISYPRGIEISRIIMNSDLRKSIQK